jgi:hypothetical protein
MIDAIIEQLRDPETGQCFKLLPAEREFLTHALATDRDGRLLYPELIYGAIKKSGKTGFAALLVLTVLLIYGGRHAEAYCVANDLEQAQGRVFEMVRRIVEDTPLLRREAKISTDRITFRSTGATVRASDFASAAGGHPTISVCRCRRARSVVGLWSRMPGSRARASFCRSFITVA